MKSVYVCARYGRREEAREVAEALLPLGVDITSTWLQQVEDEMATLAGPGAPSRLAKKDVEEVQDADAIVYLSEDEDNIWGRGGRHVEFGIAIALGKNLYIIGPLENLFHYLPRVRRFETLGDFLRFVELGQAA